MVRTLSIKLLVILGAFVAACVTINVYFPASAAEEAADRIIDQVQGAPTAEKESGSQSATPIAPTSVLVAFAGALLDALVPPAQAQDFDISTPAIRALVASMEARFPSLQPWYQSGAVGLTADALIEIRDLNLIPLQQRSQVNRLVADENNDRNALYKEIAKANGQPEWEGDVRKTFAQRWIAKAKTGWYYRSASGGWVQK